MGSDFFYYSKLLNNIASQYAMEIILLLASIITSAIFLIIFISLIKEIKTSSFNSKEIPLIILGLIYLILTILLLLWTTNFFSFDTTDFLTVFSAVLTIQTICLLTILYKIRKNKKIFYALIPFTFLIPLIFYAPQSIHLAIPISFFVILLTFLVATNIQEKITKHIIIYTSISLFLYLFAIFWQNLISILALISSILFLIFIIHFLKFLKQNPEQYFPLPQEPESPLIHFLKHFVFIIIITNFMFIGTISIHEFGHLITSSQSNCEESKIIYELQGLPHTEIKCEDTSLQNRWILGGVLFPFLIAFFLLFGGGKFIKELALQMVGFNLIISYLDMIALNFSKAIAAFTLILGIATTTFSLALLVKSRVE